VLIKAVAGGGGKGMRKVDDPADFAASLESCQREAKASFSNDEVLLEKWITSPRHIEVQVFGDSHGNVVHLFERDCSLQRRHQKVIEEAPAPGMDAATREEICGAAVRAAKAVDYEGAGTIEFIADASEGLRADRIFFMEMNTRLQVEHPVTEEITGVDLVEWQLRVASGEPIPLRQEELSINGHAIEARLYAEDPAKGFLPSPGPVERLSFIQPSLEKQDADSLTFEKPARIESAVDEGDVVSPFYDPMIAKIITHGGDREAARRNLLWALDAIYVLPITTNKPFLYECLSLPAFVEADLDTGLIARHEQQLIHPHALSETGVVTAADTIWMNRWDEGLSGRHRELFGLRLNAEPQMSISLYADGAHVEGSPFDREKVGSRNAAPLDGEDCDAVIVTERGRTFVLTLRADGTGHASAADGAILAPMPGKVIAVDVAEGDMVTAGQRLMVLEAMKMEHALTAPFDGTVTGLEASTGGQVQVEAVLCVVEPKE
ncbi:MAG: methylcrotonoyl-CoA carboxylase, partial [Erythrobacter sp.]|nr:methylcrotonoyl-CoA carboxylase [Erythrobacter sp.]